MDDQSNRRDALPLIAVIQARDGWAVKEELEVGVGLTTAEMDEYLELLERTGELTTVDLGRMTLVVLQDIDVADAIVGLSDREEREWRQRNDERLPRLDERHIDDE